MSIELATEQDLEGIMQANKGLKSIEHKIHNPETVKLLISNEQFYVAKGDEVYGALSLGEKDEFLYIYTLSVREEHKHRGVGTSLVEFAISLAREGEYPGVKVSSHHSFHAKEFYLKHGFEIEKDYGDGYLFTMQF
jgi:ribosomal protein S18 acetylase RimI-like enzyme